MSLNVSTTEHIHLIISFRGQNIDMDLYSKDSIFLGDLQNHIVSTYTQRMMLITSDGLNENEVSVAVTGSISSMMKKPSACISNMDETNVLTATAVPTTVTSLNPSDIKIMYKGRVLSDYATPLFHILSSSSSSKKISSAKVTIIRLLAMGQSTKEIQQDHLQSQQALHSHHHKLIRDDITEQGIKTFQKNRKQGQKQLQVHSLIQQRKEQYQIKYGFQNIQTLPNLPQQTQATNILTSLAQDPGILACMTKHQWSVGCLSEMYPQGKVGESEVCILGLNRNQGQEILLRLRTDDLQGFRKISMIRQVLYHELAHNVYNEHDGNFFLLMRQIEKECIDNNWMMNSTGYGLMNPKNLVGMIEEEENGRRQSYNKNYGDDDDDSDDGRAFRGGVYRLGRGKHDEEVHPSSSLITNTTSSRELRAQAALNRLQLEKNDPVSEKKKDQQQEDDNDYFCRICQCYHHPSLQQPYPMNEKCCKPK